MFPLIRTFSYLLARVTHAAKSPKESGAHVGYTPHLYIKLVPIVKSNIRAVRAKRPGNFPRINSRPFTSRASVFAISAGCHRRLSTTSELVIFNINYNIDILAKIMYPDKYDNFNDSFKKPFASSLQRVLE